MYIICRSRESETIRPALYQQKSRKLLQKNLDFSWILHLQMRMPLGHEAEVRSWHGSIFARHAVAISAWPWFYSLFGGRNQKHTPQLVCTPVLLTGWNPPRAGSVGWRWVSQISGHLMGPYGFGTHHNRHYATPFFWEEWPRMAEGHCRGRRRCQFVMVSTLMARAWKWSMERKHRPEGSWRQCTRGLGAELWQTCGAIKKHSAIQSEYWDYRDWGLQYGDPLPPLFFFFSVILWCM